MVTITEETVQHVQLLLEMEAAAKVARPSEGKPCSDLTLEEELARMRFYKLVTPSGIIAIAELVRLLERAASGEAMASGVTLSDKQKALIDEEIRKNGIPK